jgi:hypothetical protein
VGNSAQGFSGYGGALDAENNTSVTVTGSSFTGNTATGDDRVVGGAIRILNDASQQAQSSISDSSFLDNGAIVRSMSTNYGGSADGGALYNTYTPLTISGSSFIGNQAVGGPGSGAGTGGAIEDDNSSTNSSSSVNISNSLLMYNSAIGGSTLSNGGFPFAGPAGGGGLALFFDTVTVGKTSIFGNQVIGGAATQSGNFGGNSYGGGILNLAESLTITGSTIQSNQAVGGAGTDGATGGNGDGGGIFSEGTLTMTGGLISTNVALGGAGGGNGEGGGIYTDGTTTLMGVLVTLNQADGGSDGGEGIGGGLYINSGTTTLLGKTKVTGNSATTSNNDIYGTYST